MHSTIARVSTIFLSLLLLIVIPTGCVQPPLPAGKPPAVIPKPPSPQAEIAEMGKRSDFWRKFQCKMRIDVNGKTAKFSSRAIVLIKSPNLVRFETFTPIGTTAALYVSNETGAFLLIPSQKTIFTAKRSQTLVQEFLGGMNLPVGLLSRLLSGSIPPERLQNIQSHYKDGLLRLISRNSAGYVEWQVAGGMLDRVFIGSAEFEGEVSYDPPVPLDEEATPEAIHISSKGSSMEIHVEKMQPAAQFPPGVFHLPVPAGVRQVELDKAK